MKFLVIVCALVLQPTMGYQSTEMVTMASNEFSFKLYEQFSHGQDNILVCPISLHVALALLHQGAGGSTADELATVLRLGGNNEYVKQGYQSLLSGLQDNVLKIATKLYPKAHYPLNETYVNIARQYFLSDVEGIDYSNPNSAANTINQYVEEHTNNKIHNLISPGLIDGYTRLLVINAVHFKAMWKKQFQTVRDDYFKVSPGKPVIIKMMYQTNYYYYKEDPALDAKFLKMDYTEGNYSMVFILPNKDDGLPALEANLVNMNLESLLRNLNKQKVHVTIPKFKLEMTNSDLKDTLQKMGISKIFSEGEADLNSIARGGGLYVSNVIQKTFIDVNEKGTEAAAATGFFVTTLSSSPVRPPLPVFRADHPFFFALVSGSDTALFFGRYSIPS